MNWVRGHCIGRGAYGTVHLVTNKLNNVVSAVKSVNQSSCLPPQIKALENEIRILKKLKSPYIVEYLGDDVTLESSSSSSFMNLHMEYLLRGTLADVARTSGSELDIASYIRCILSGLNYLHSEMGIVHCDVKGGNVLVGSMPGIAKLADFGSAIEVDSVGANKIVPRGSPLWMAPEVVRGEYQGPESDVWSLGCTLIEVVTGKPPWQEHYASVNAPATSADTLCMIGYSSELPRFPNKLSETGKDFLSKCLKREKSERWSCDQLLNHPFVALCSSPDPSPRGVLEWFTSDMEEDEEQEVEHDTIGQNYEIICQNYRKGIEKLGSVTGVLWESDGWLVVREREDVTVTEVEVEGAWLNFEHNDVVIESEFENIGVELEYSDFVGVGESSSSRFKLEYAENPNDVVDSCNGFACDNLGEESCHSGEGFEKAVGSYKNMDYNCKLMMLFVFNFFILNCYLNLMKLNLINIQRSMNFFIPKCIPYKGVETS